MDLSKKFYDEQHYLIHALKESYLENEILAYNDWYIRKRNFDEDDALDLAWDNFKPLFKKLIDHNKDIFDDELHARNTN